MDSVAVITNPMKEFQDRVTEKLRKDIGEMLPDNVLADLVQRAVNEQFFKPCIVESRFHKETKPSWFAEEVTNIARPIIRETVQAYVNNNHDAIKKAVEEFLSRESLSLIAFAAMREATQQDIYQFADEIVTRIRQG